MPCCWGAPKTLESSPPSPRARKSKRAGRQAVSLSAQNGHLNGLPSPSEGNQGGGIVLPSGSPSDHTEAGQVTERYNSDEDFASCRDDFSVTDGSHLEGIAISPRTSAPFPPGQSKSARFNGQEGSASQPDPAHRPPHLQQEDPAEAADGSLQGVSETDSDVGGGGEGSPKGFVGCLHLLDIGNTSGRHPEAHGERERSKAHAGSHSRRMGEKPDAGCSMHPRDNSQSALDVSYCWEDASASRFNIRSLDYMKTKIKQPSANAMYTLVAADIFALPKKQHHISKFIQLPPRGPAVMAGDVALPPLLVFNIQLPLYMATLFGPQDGEGVSIVFYFKLPEDFDPAKFENQKALALFKRFVTNGREADGTSTRDRLKLIPRIVNVDEWVKKGPLSPAEHKVLVTYNDKPILSRPQHTFHTGRGYLEVDLDCHQYTYLARRAITSYLTRLPHVVWENAFVVQGNGQDELPEHLIGVSRIYRFDFKQAKPIPPPRSVTSGEQLEAVGSNVESP